MSFGFLGKPQARMQITETGKAYTVVSVDKRRFVHFTDAWLNSNGNLSHFQYDPTNTGSAPDNQRLRETVGLIAFNNDARSRMNAAPTEDVAGDDIGFFGSNKTTSFLEYNSSAALTPTTRIINIIWHNPGAVKILQAVINEGPGNGGDGRFLSGVFAMPYFWNLVGVNFSFNGNGTNDFTTITSITGNWGRRLKSISIGSTLSTSRALTSIANKFPATLERIMLMSTISNLNTLIADCVNLKTIWSMALVTPHAYAETFPSVVGVVTNGFQDATFSIAHVTHLEFMGIMNSAITSLTMPSVNNNTLKKLALITTGISNANFQAALDYAIASTAMIFLNVRNLNKTASKTIIDSTLSTALEQFYTYGNIITGDITLTTARTVCISFRVGSNLVSITTAASKNQHQNVDVTGLTHVVTLDLSNSRIEDLELPVNTVIQNLYLGGNKLDVTVNTNLISQVLAMTNLRILFFSGPLVLSVDVENGQNSTNGLGANLDVSALTLLTVLQANKCLLTGTLKLPSSIIGVAAQANNITGIDTGTLSALTGLYMGANASFDFDFTRVVNIREIMVNDTSVIAIDLSGRTSTQQWGTSASNSISLHCPGCTVLTIITFPTTQARSVIAIGSSNPINISGCTLLASLPNIENLNYNLLTSAAQRQFIANDCALNIDFKFGINNWLPAAIAIQNNAMSNPNADLNIDNIYQGRRKWDTTVLALSMNIAGTNAAPSGTFIAPSGYKSGTITGITKASTAVVTVSAIGTLANNEVIRIRSVVGMTQVNSQYFMIKNISGNTFELYNEAGTTPINSTAYTTYVSGGAAYVEGTPANAKEQLYVLVNVFAWTMTYN